MFTNNFCPTCRQIADEFLDSNILNKNDKIFNQPNSTFSNPQDSRQCSGCERIFSPLEFSPLEQGQCDELPIDQRYIPDIDISCFSESSAWKNISDHLNLLMSKELDSTSTDLIRYNDNWNLVTPMRCDDNTQNNSVIDDFDFFDFLKDIPLQEYKETVDFESNGVSNLPEFDFDLLDMEEFDTISTDHMLLNENFDANLIDSIMLSDANEQNVNLNTFAVGGPSEESESSQTVSVETQSNDQQSNFPETVDSEIQESSSVQPAMILEDCNVPAIISCEETTLEVPTSKSNIDLDAIVSEIFSKSEENELTQKTVVPEFQLYFQPQVETESNSIWVYDGVNGCTIEPLLTKQADVIDVAEKSEEAEKLYNLLDQNKPKAEGLKYYYLVHAIYSLDTNQRVSFNEIQEKIYNNFVTDKNDEKSLTCKIDHECPKVFDSLSVVVDHLFSNFFYIHCKACEGLFYYPSNFRRHRRSCAKTSKESRSKSFTQNTNSIGCPSSNVCDSGDIQLQLGTGTEFDGQMSDGNQETFQEDVRCFENSNITLQATVDSANDINAVERIMKDKRKPVRSDKKVLNRGFGSWDHPFYRRGTNEKGTVDEMQMKISENYTYDIFNARTYVCLIDHGCRRFFRQLKLIKRHIFSHFFYFKCENCGAKAGYYDNLECHLRHCKEKAKSDLIISTYKQSISEKPDSPVDSESQMRSDVLSLLVSLIVEN